MRATSAPGQLLSVIVNEHQQRVIEYRKAKDQIPREQIGGLIRTYRRAARTNPSPIPTTEAKRRSALSACACPVLKHPPGSHTLITWRRLSFWTLRHRLTRARLE